MYIAFAGTDETYQDNVFLTGFPRSYAEKISSTKSNQNVCFVYVLVEETFHTILLWSVYNLHCASHEHT